MEQKTILVFFGSPRLDGFTSKLLKAFLKPFPEGSCRAEFVDTYREKLEPCIACGLCKTREACRFRDMDDIDRLLREADLLVFATPVYNLTFPAPLKAVIDRFQRYFEARFSLGLRPPIPKYKPSVLLAALGSKDLAGVEMISRQLKTAFTVMNTSLAQTAVWSDTDHAGEGAEAEATSRAEAAALAIIGELW